eukprot:scaffold43732_cov24-Tisochrysis_lutea.AAC.1
MVEGGGDGPAEQRGRGRGRGRGRRGLPPTPAPRPCARCTGKRENACYEWIGGIVRNGSLVRVLRGLVGYK